MAKSENELFDDIENNDFELEQDQLTDKDLKINHQVRKQIDELLENKPLGSEDSDDDYLDHYYDFDDFDK